MCRMVIRFLVKHYFSFFFFFFSSLFMGTEPPQRELFMGSCELILKISISPSHAKQHLSLKALLK